MVILQRRVAGLSVETLDRFVLRARRAAGIKGAVNVLVTSSTTVRSLNRRFRDRDKATDVLSFPSSPISVPDRTGSERKSEKRSAWAGDIAISAEIAARSAASLRHSTADEVKILILHGLLHLAGFDHERDNGEMARKELKLRQTMGLPTGLIERVRPSAPYLAPRRNSSTGRASARRRS